MRSQGLMVEEAVAGNDILFFTFNVASAFVQMAMEMSHHRTRFLARKTNRFFYPADSESKDRIKILFETAPAVVKIHRPGPIWVPSTTARDIVAAFPVAR